MAAVELDPLAKSHKLAPITDEAVTVIENLTDTAFWQLMLGDDLDICERDIELLCACLRWRLAQIRISYRTEALEPPSGALSPVSEVPSPALAVTDDRDAAWWLVDNFQTAWAALRPHLGQVDDFDFSDLLTLEADFGRCMDQASRGRP